MSADRAALTALTEVTDGGAFSNLTLKKAAAGLSPEEARAVYASVYGTIEHLAYIDYMLAAFTEPHRNRFVRNAVRLGAHAILFLKTPPHAAVSRAVRLTAEIGKPALRGYVNGVLRALARGPLPDLPEDPARRAGVLYGCPGWLCSEWSERFGADGAEALLSAPASGLCLRAQWPSDTEEIASLLPCPHRRGKWDSCALYPEKGFDVAAFRPFADGRCAVQGEGAMLIVRALGDVAGKRVLDACAAPGGKSAYLYSLCRGNVGLVCLEKHPHRAELIRKNFDRLGVHAEVVEGDALSPNPAWENAFDAVLLDVPCSGLGLLHEKPEILSRITREDVASLAKIQAGILRACAPCVRPGGTLVYATCTISRAENEDTVLAFLAEHAEFRPEPAPLPVENDGMLQLLPHVHGTDGFFIARMKRCI